MPELWRIKVDELGTWKARSHKNTILSHKDVSMKKNGQDCKIKGEEKNTKTKANFEMSKNIEANILQTIFLL
jgi:hypothetical protein